LLYPSHHLNCRSISTVVALGDLFQSLSFARYLVVSFSLHLFLRSVTVLNYIYVDRSMIAMDLWKHFSHFIFSFRLSGLPHILILLFDHYLTLPHVLTDTNSDHHPMMPIRRRTNNFSSRGLVKISASCCVVSISCIVTSPLNTAPRKWWYLMFICLVRGRIFGV
jgi:hypothetical protein